MGDDEEVARRIKGGADVNQQWFSTDQSPTITWPLTIAVQKKDYDNIERLLAADANQNPEASTSKAQYPMNAAVFADDPQVLSMLIAHGGNVDREPRHPVDSLLMYATFHDKVNSTAALIKGTALHIAASRGNKNIVHLLLAAGADTAIRDKDGNTAADLAENFSSPARPPVKKAAKPKKKKGPKRPAPPVWRRALWRPARLLRLGGRRAPPHLQKKK